MSEGAATISNCSLQTFYVFFVRILCIIYVSNAENVYSILSQNGKIPFSDAMLQSQGIFVSITSSNSIF